VQTWASRRRLRAPSSRLSKTRDARSVRLQKNLFCFAAPFAAYRQIDREGDCCDASGIVFPSRFVSVALSYNPDSACTRLEAQGCLHTKCQQVAESRCRRSYGAGFLHGSQVGVKLAK
jgi:hypothetical protein